MKTILLFATLTTSLMAGCIANRVVIPEVQVKNNTATIVGSRTMHNGARVEAYIVAINGEPIESKRGYKTEHFLTPGSYEITVETNQCHKARHTFSLSLSPNTVYVAQGTTVDYHTHKIWISETHEGKLVTEQALARKFGNCSIAVSL